MLLSLDVVETGFCDDLARSLYLSFYNVEPFR